MSTLPAAPGRPWASAATLSKVLGAKLSKALSEIERSASYLDASDVAANRVNTSTSRNDPIARWVRYREGYSPDLVEMLLAEFPPATESVVLDPMCGSGSTQIAAQRRGYSSVGFDVNPYAVLVSRVKTALLTTEEAAQVERGLADVEAGGIRCRWTDGSRGDSVAKYFPSRNYASLRGIRDWIDLWAAGRPRDFLYVALLSIVELCSNRRKDGNGLVTRPSPVNDPFGLFLKHARSMLSEARSQAVFHSAASTTRLVSAIRFDVSETAAELSLAGHVGAIVFSPPYPNSFDYFESYKLELLFGKLVDEDEFAARRRALIRSYRQSGSSTKTDLPLVEEVIEEVLRALPQKEALTGARDNRTRLVPNLLRGYFLDMREVLRACARVLAPSSFLHIVVDQSAYAGIPIPTDLLLADIAAREGFSLERVAFCRPARTSGQQLRLQPELRHLLRETIVTLRTV